MLLNPWAVDVQSKVIGIGGGAGGRFGGRKGSARGGGGGAPAARAASPLTLDPGTFPALDFLPEPSGILPNLRPSDAGVLRIPLADLGPGQHVQVLAVDRAGMVRAELALPWRPFVSRDRRLPQAVDAERHLVEERRIDYLGSGKDRNAED